MPETERVSFHGALTHSVDKRAKGYSEKLTTCNIITHTVASCRSGAAVGCPPRSRHYRRPTPPSRSSPRERVSRYRRRCTGCFDIAARKASNERCITRNRAGETPKLIANIVLRKNYNGMLVEDKK